MTLPPLGPILFATIAAPRFDETLRAYADFLDYRPIARAPIAPAQARLWDTPDLAGRASAILAPEGKAGSGLLRIVESDAVPAYRPLRHHGWGATELIVRDVDAVAARLAQSPFAIVGPALGLSGRSVLRAMQVVGPAGEVLYLTSISGDLPGFDLPRAALAIDRTFIAVLAAKDLEASRAFYEERFAVKRVSDREVAIGVINRAYDFPPDRKHRLSSLQTSGQCLIEIDQYPGEAIPNPAPPGALPAGVAMMSFASDRAAMLRGPAGEWIELIESP